MKKFVLLVASFACCACLCTSGLARTFTNVTFTVDACAVKNQLPPGTYKMYMVTIMGIRQKK